MMGIGRTIGVTIKLIAHPIRPGRVERTEKPLANLLEAGLALLLSISSEVRLAHDAANALVKIVDCSAFLSGKMITTFLGYDYLLVSGTSNHL